MQKCWLLETSVDRVFSHETITTTLTCFVSLPDFDKRNGIHSLILHKDTVSLEAVAKARPSVSKLYDVC